ncbi:MAG: heparan N-sulfatase [Opitutus sp.]|nr:heparan N-sulfatase [Opitutus sp.]
MIKKITRDPMLKRITLQLFAVCAAATGLAAGKPNILFCIADDASYQHFSANGCGWVQTPAFDHVAREGLRFTRAYTPNAKCAPSRASVLTGRNSWQLEAAADHGGYYPPGYRTFMEALGRNGYHAGFTGKGWGPGDPGSIDGKPRLLTGPVFSEIKTKPPTANISPVDYAANLAEFLKQKPAGQPFCFWYGAHEPHRGYQYGSGVKVAHKSLAQIDRVPSYWPDTATVRNDMLDYALEVEYFDQQLGRMLDLLQQAGELENTLIIVTSDNGMPFPRSKGTTYEISLHMPLAIRWPAGIAQPGRTVQDYVSFIDIAPTVIELAGLTAESAGMEPLQGRSLSGILTNRNGGQVEPGREALIVGQERHDIGRPNDVGYPARGLFLDGFLYVHNFEPTRWPMCDPVTGYLNTDGGPTKTEILAQNRRGINHALWVLNFDRKPADELYDLSRDPDCVFNLADDPGFTARRDAMQARLFAGLRSQHDPRMEGKGAIFDQYPNASPNRDFYNRWMKGEHLKANWVEETDFEAPDFDPERPLRPKASNN